MFELARVVPVVWNAEAREAPPWLEGSAIEIRRTEPERPRLAAVSCSTARHEALEALRWARQLLAQGEARPEEIAIAAASPAEYDDHFLAFSADANLDLHFVHGIGALSTRDGQAAAALAEVLLHGLSQDRVRRLVALLRTMCPELTKLPQEWPRILPPDAPLLLLVRWQQLFASLRPEKWPGGVDPGPVLLPVLELLSRGPEVAMDAGERLLSGSARAIWRRALQEGPPAALDITLAELRIDDGQEPATTVAWMPASSLAACPRRFVRLVGLTSRGWPRGISDERLLPDHVIPLERLDPLPIAEADRRDFRTICNTTADTIVMSRSRRDADGRQLGRSPLVPRDLEETYLRRARVPQHAMSEADRLLARPAEFETLPVAASAGGCWGAWRRNEITGHDGLVDANHPLLHRVLSQPQSATSLRLLLRDPLGYVWKYALRFDAPDIGEEPITLDPRSFGNLVHEILASAVSNLETEGGFATVDQGRLTTAVASARSATAARWEGELPVPPAIVWRRTLHEAEAQAIAALAYPLQPLPDQRSWAEVPFGGSSTPGSGRLPWDPAASVAIPETGLAIRGVIDRLDLAGDQARARVTDYKTGRVPKDVANIALSGGRELQRCLYAFAVRAVLGDAVDVEASLLYPRPGGGMYTLDSPEDALATLARHLALARENLLKGLALPGVDAESPYNPFAFALPGNAKAVYCAKKLPLARALMGDATAIWDMP